MLKSGQHLQVGQLFTLQFTLNMSLSEESVRVLISSFVFKQIKDHNLKPILAQISLMICSIMTTLLLHML